MFFVVAACECPTVEDAGACNDACGDPGGILPLENLRWCVDLDFLGEST
jgi:hypothetical protein